MTIEEFQNYVGTKRIPNLLFEDEFLYHILKYDEELHEFMSHYNKNEFCKKSYNNEEILSEAGDLLWQSLAMLNLLQAKYNKNAITGSISLVDLKNHNLNVINSIYGSKDVTTELSKLSIETCLLLKTCSDNIKLEVFKNAMQLFLKYAYTTLFSTLITFNIAKLDISDIIRSAVEKNKRRHPDGFSFEHYAK